MNITKISKNILDKKMMARFSTQVSQIRNKEICVLVTGASRGIGKAIAEKFASEYKDKAKIALFGRSLEYPSHPKTQGTLLETLKIVESYGAMGIPYSVDIQEADSLKESIRKAIKYMGGLDVLINNASVLYTNPTLNQMDLLYKVNTRASLLSMKTCKTELEKRNGTIVTISPPIRLGRLDWISNHPEYTISKYSMTLGTLAYGSNHIRANCIWPRYTVATNATMKLENEGFNGAYTKGRSTKEFATAVFDLSISDLNTQTIYDDDITTLPSTNAPLDVFSQECTKKLRKN